ncbi:MAG TPA: hypothetical protein PKA07_11355 [Micropruina sp.]|nr:hypothetical protein [Micropruina sp.]
MWMLLILTLGVETPGLTWAECTRARLMLEVRAELTGEPVETACVVEV